MLKVEGYSAVYIIFPSKAAFIDEEAGYSNEQKFTALHKIFKCLFNYLMFRLCRVISSTMHSDVLNRKVQKLKASAKELFKDLEDTDLFTL